MKRNGILFIVLLLFIRNIAFSANPVKNNSFETKDTMLYQIILEQDSLLFSAFNNRDFNLFEKFFSDSLEIYQDNIGLRNYRQSMDAFKGLFNGEYVLQRELIKSTLEVYPVKDYGAIEVGEHKFCHEENNAMDCGTYKFVHIWNNKNGQWRIVRIITYDH